MLIQNSSEVINGQYTNEVTEMYPTELPTFDIERNRLVLKF